MRNINNLTIPGTTTRDYPKPTGQGVVVIVYPVAIMNAQDPIKSKRVYRFAEEYAKDRNGTQAAIRAGYSVATAGVQASTLLANPKVQALVQERVDEVSKDVKFEAMDVLREWVTLATADASKISKTRKLNCRHCYGVGHEYRWKAYEYAQACDDAMKAVDAKGNPCPQPPPSCAGGFGFKRLDDPNPECPRCEGDGVEDLVFCDMDSLQPAERKLIAAVERTKDGIKVKMRDQDAALQNIAKYLGLMIEKRELTGKNGAPLVAAVVPVELPADAAALAAIYSQIVGG